MPTSQLVWLHAAIQSGRARVIRKQAGLTLRQLAPEVPIDFTTLGRWENGQRPRTEQAERYARLLRRLERETRRAASGAPESEAS